MPSRRPSAERNERGGKEPVPRSPIPMRQHRAEQRLATNRCSNNTDHGSQRKQARKRADESSSVKQRACSEHSHAKKAADDHLRGGEDERNVGRAAWRVANGYFVPSVRPAGLFAPAPGRAPLATRDCCRASWS
jgi:hypothetical protein